MDDEKNNSRDYAGELVNGMSKKNRNTLLNLHRQIIEAINEIAKTPKDIEGLVELAENFTVWAKDSKKNER